MLSIAAVKVGCGGLFQEKNQCLQAALRAKDCEMKIPSLGKQKHFLYVDGSTWQETRNNKC